MYPNLNGVGSVVPNGTGVLAADDLAAAAAVHGEYLFARKCQIRRIMFVVTAAVVGTSTAPVVRFSKRITPGSDTGAVVIGSLTVPDGTVIGKVLYKDVDPMVMDVGDALKVENTQIAVGGTIAGSGCYSFEIEDCPQDKHEETDFLASV